MAQTKRCRFPLTTALLEQAVRDRVFPGCAFAVLAGGDAGSLEDAAQAVGRFTYEPDSRLVEPGTVFDLASLTKVLATTVAVMRLYERRLLALDVPVTDWLPEFAAAEHSDIRRSRVTLRMLLDHSSGLPGYVRLFESTNDRLAMIDACLRQPLTADPGTRSEYSDIGFIILGYLVEKIAGEQLDSFCQREIFAPLDMSTSGFCPNKELRALIPPTEDDRSFRHRIIQGEVHDENACVMGGVAGHAGLFSDALDPLRMAACLLTGGATTPEFSYSRRKRSRSSQNPPGSRQAPREHWAGIHHPDRPLQEAFFQHARSGILASPAPHYGLIWMQVSLSPF